MLLRHDRFGKHILGPSKNRKRWAQLIDAPYGSLSCELLNIIIAHSVDLPDNSHA